MPGWDRGQGTCKAGWAPISALPALTLPRTGSYSHAGQATTFQQSVETCALGHDKTSGTVEINKWKCLQCWYNDIQMLSAPVVDKRGRGLAKAIANLSTAGA